MNTVFDMDGTLVKWQQEKTLFDVSKPGYFRNVPEIKSMVEAARILYKRGHRISTLSAVLPYGYCRTDKLRWIEAHAPFIRKEDRRFVPYSESKADVMRSIPEAVLVDDYTKNLLDVRAKAPKTVLIKCMNGLNDTHHTWNGARVSIYSSPEIIAYTIEGIAEKQNI